MRVTRMVFRALLPVLMCWPWSSAIPAEGDSRVGSLLQVREFSIPGVKVFGFDSRIMGREYEITVRFPRIWQSQPETRFPALLITDANLAFAAASHALNAVETELENPLILVAVGTPSEAGFLAHQKRRVYEFSPPGWDLDDPFGQTVASSCVEWGLRPEQCVGGAEEYYRFLTQELLPVMVEAFRIDSEAISLGGVSAGGFFAAWVIFQKDNPFRNFLISSPAMAYGDDVIFALEAARAETTKDLKAGVYLASGGLEMDDPFIEGLGKVVSGQAQFGARLRSRGYPGLKLKSEMHPGLGHTDVVPVSYAQGLRFLFGKTEKVQ